ncbi:MAG: GyrI-like domain-containing protein [Bacteroidetes bacterium]|nr:GyrI-like domain-containing protein [Bacteroidota bacterium]
MKNSFFRFILVVTVVSLTFSCNNSKDAKSNEIQVNDSLQRALTEKTNLDKIANTPGIAGVFDVPEMLTICKMDSAPMKNVSFKVAKNYSVLETEMNEVGAELDGMPGMLTYNNDTANFIFECVLPIKTFPKKQPKTCKIVVLEACPMLIHNFYGPYNHLFNAYDAIRKYIAANKLQQSGPMREFYLSDPTVEKDPAKWQTRIMVPVIKVK